MNTIYQSLNQFLKTASNTSSCNLLFSFRAVLRLQESYPIHLILREFVFPLFYVKSRVSRLKPCFTSPNILCACPKPETCIPVQVVVCCSFNSVSLICRLLLLLNGLVFYFGIFYSLPYDVDCFLQMEALREHEDVDLLLSLIQLPHLIFLYIHAQYWLYRLSPCLIWCFCHN